MQDHGQIARAFAAWQRAHQKLNEAEERLAAANLAWKQGRTPPPPDSLRSEVAALKAEQDRRYDVAADALRTGRSTGPAPLAASDPKQHGRSPHAF